MKDWIYNLKRWIELHPKPNYDDEPSYFDLDQEEPWQYPVEEREKTDNTSHMRSCSAESSFSFSSIPGSISGLDAAGLTVVEPQPPPLQLGILRSYSDDYSPTKSVGSYEGSPTESESLYEHSSIVINANDGFEAPIQHSRGASYAGQERYSHRTEILAKMSMPNLRSSKIDFRKESPDASQARHPSSYAVNNSTREEAAPYQDSLMSNDAEKRVPRSSNVLNEDESTPRAIYSVASERNSYFRRLSTFPASITLPQSLLYLVDTARSMLFAACQVYQTLDHYIVNTDERFSSVLRKVLEPASSDMLQLIASLDRFDSISRKALPTPAVCKAVIESCRDTAAAFNKVVRVMTLQLQVLVTCDDVRYSRLLLIELYAATAEIACAWRKMVPEIHHLRSLLHTNWSINQPATSTSEAKFTSPLDLHAPAPRHHINGSGSNGISTSISRARTVRRHAGSFSSRDVEIGKQLPSHDSSYGGGSQGRPHAFRAPRRQATTPAALPLTQNNLHVPSSPTSAIRPTSRGAELIDRYHSRNGSQLSIHPSSSASVPPSIPNKVTTSLDLPSSSRMQVDKEALHAIKGTVDIAPSVWDMIESALEDVLPVRVDIRDGLNRARAVTKRLADMVVTIQDNDSLSDRKLLREDARLFLKAVVQLSGAIKAYREAQDVPPMLRNSMIKLTNATEEFAILLHVSSFSPSTPKPYSPMATNPQLLGHIAQHSDSQLQSSLSRSQSAQASSNLKTHATELQGGPRSALPTQSFMMIPSIRRARARDSP
ncbi:hypothetical protein AX15_003931 [Amanita polypyramis BW_CC]|nr:hypothetical protein AX15_003931 [Amanita polypyramis BW_CC]